MGKFNANRLKVNLKLALNRIRVVAQKKAALRAHQLRDVAVLLERGKEESARIRAEFLIKEDVLLEALEILELYTELLETRFAYIVQQRHCDVAIAEAVNTVIYGAPRAGIAELSVVRAELVARYGKDFTLAAMENKHEVVNGRLVQKLQLTVPEPYLVNQYLCEIARKHGIAYVPSKLLQQELKGSLVPNLAAVAASPAAAASHVGAALAGIVLPDLRDAQPIVAPETVEAEVVEAITGEQENHQPPAKLSESEKISALRQKMQELGLTDGIGDVDHAFVERLLHRSKAEQQKTRHHAHHHHPAHPPHTHLPSKAKHHPKREVVTSPVPAPLPPYPMPYPFPMAADPSMFAALPQQALPMMPFPLPGYSAGTDVSPKSTMPSSGPSLTATDADFDDLSKRFDVLRSKRSQ